MGDHLETIHFVFFRGRNIRKIRQICQILLISLKYGKTQMRRFRFHSPIRSVDFQQDISSTMDIRGKCIIKKFRAKLQQIFV